MDFSESSALHWQGPLVLAERSARRKLSFTKKKRKHARELHATQWGGIRDATYHRRSDGQQLNEMASGSWTKWPSQQIRAEKQIHHVEKRGDERVAYT